MSARSAAAQRRCCWASLLGLPHIFFKGAVLPKNATGGAGGLWAGGGEEGGWGGGECVRMCGREGAHLPMLQLAQVAHREGDEERA